MRNKTAKKANTLTVSPWVTKEHLDRFSFQNMEYQLYKKAACHFRRGGVRTPCTLPLDPSLLVVLELLNLFYLCKQTGSTGDSCTRGLTVQGYKTIQLFCIKLYPLLYLALKITKNPDNSKLKRSISTESEKVWKKRGLRAKWIKSRILLFCKQCPQLDVTMGNHTWHFPKLKFKYYCAGYQNHGFH